MSDALDDVLAASDPDKPKGKRTLDWLPDHEAGRSAWRDWLTTALGPPGGYRFQDFIRHGRQRTDSCDLVLATATGSPMAYEIDEQRFLSTPGTLRATVVAVTDGLLRPPSLTKAELEDVWIALVALATVTANQSLKDEASDWIEQIEGAAKAITGHTLMPPGRLDALLALRDRGLFNTARAREFTDPKFDPDAKLHPALLIDAESGERYMRVGEVACYLRHVIGVGTLSHAKLDGRLAAIGIKRHLFAARRDRSYAKADLYRLPEAS